MLRHFPWWKRTAESTQRVKWPRTIASQMYDASRRPSACSEKAQAERDGDLRDQRDVERAARVPRPCSPPVYTSARR